MARGGPGAAGADAEAITTMTLIIAPEIQCRADRIGAEQHVVNSSANGNMVEFMVLCHGGRKRAQEIAEGWIPPADDGQERFL